MYKVTIEGRGYSRLEFEFENVFALAEFINTTFSHSTDKEIAMKIEKKEGEVNGI